MPSTNGLAMEDHEDIVQSPEGIDSIGDPRDTATSNHLENFSSIPTPPSETNSDSTDAAVPAEALKPLPAIKTTHLPPPSPPNLPSSAPPVPTLPTIPGGNSDEDTSSDSASLEVNTDVPRSDKSHSVSGPASAVVDPKPETPVRPRQASGSDTPSGHHVRRLSAVEMQQLASEPESLPIAVVREGVPVDHAVQGQTPRLSVSEQLQTIRKQVLQQPELMNSSPVTEGGGRNPRAFGPSEKQAAGRTLSTPPGNRRRSSQTRHNSSPRRNSFNPSARPPPLQLNLSGNGPFGAQPSRPPSQLQPPQPPDPALPSPMPPSIPLPPMSIPTHLQLELSTQRPSPLYIHQSMANDVPYESMADKVERLMNVLVLPVFLERTLIFGALACLDAWLYNFTILPMRFLQAVGVLARWWLYVIGKETKWAVRYVWGGIGRLRSRGRRGSVQTQCSECDSGGVLQSRDRSQSGARHPLYHSREMSSSSTQASVPAIRVDSDAKMNGNGRTPLPQDQTNSLPHQKDHRQHDRHGSNSVFRHRRSHSQPSNLTSMHKADLLQGFVIICSSMFLMNMDASRMYHVIRGQDAIKLYVIYNVLEVGDRLLSALGQDIFECLLSDESLSRNKKGRSKIMLPFGLFLLALVYTCIHSVALYYQVVALNVAVNSYSNALLTLLLSNQFVEIKSTVFKRFEKDNLFQLTCADITERFQLWLMLFIIGMRNVVEVGGLSIPGAGMSGDLKASNTTPLHSPSILPHSFTVIPSWLLSGEVLSPFFIVIGSEMLVDTIKHAYVNKFNKIRPKFYSRILDILCKDYYTNAFKTPTLTRRVGLAVLPLACLFIRASIQTYHMFLSTHVTAPLSTQTSLSPESATPSSPVMLAALDRLDGLFRDALGRAVYGSPYADPTTRPWLSWTTDDLIAAVTMLVVFFIAFLVLLVIKILLGMVLLRYSRNRYARMKQAEHLITAGQEEPESYDAKGKRLGGYGHVEVSDDKRRWINSDKKEGLKGSGRPSEKDKEKAGGEHRSAAAAAAGYQGVHRFEMVTKRIW